MILRWKGKYKPWNGHIIFRPLLLVGEQSRWVASNLSAGNQITWWNQTRLSAWSTCVNTEDAGKGPNMLRQVIEGRERFGECHLNGILQHLMRKANTAKEDETRKRKSSKILLQTCVRYRFKLGSHYRRETCPAGLLHEDLLANPLARKFDFRISADLLWFDFKAESFFSWTHRLQCGWC